MYFFIFKSEVSFINTIGVYGSYLSIVGLFITFIQIIDVKNENIRIAEAVKQSKKMINDLQTINSLPEAISLLNDCKHYLRDKKNELAHLRMSDARISLISLRSNKEFFSFVDETRYGSMLTRLNIDINNINKQIMGSKSKNLRYDILIDNLEELSTYVDDIKSQIMNKRITN